MSQSPFSKVIIMPTQSISEVQKQNTPTFKELANRVKGLEKESDASLTVLTNPHTYAMTPEFYLPHHRGKGHSTKGSNNDSSPAYTKKRKAKRRLNKKHNK